MIQQSIYTVANEPFTYEEHCQLAALIYKRFGWDDASAACAWRRLLENNCSDYDFLALALLASSQVRRGLK